MSSHACILAFAPLAMRLSHALAAMPFDEAARMPPPQRRRPIERALACLDGDPLASRFHGWLGFSGRRYVFSVYPGDREAPLALANALILRVRRAEDGLRAVEAAWNVGDAELRDWPEAATAADEDALEYHIYLLAPSHDERSAVALDLELARLSGAG